MIRIDVPSSSGSYPIHIGAGLLRRADLLLEATPAAGVVVVTDDRVGPLHLATLLEGLGPRVLGSVTLRNGEAHKDLDAWRQVLDGLVAAGLSRAGGVVALGGGVVGDVAGFAAASYLRGVAVTQIPTTLLAQVDAAIGGKTGVDHPAGKNLIGAFHQPRAVISDLEVLATLDARDLRAALSEVVKHALIADADLLMQLEASLDAVLARDPAVLAPVIARCCDIKARIVAADEREAGARASLNLGHTFGHAIETASGYALRHGEAVAIGLVLAAALAEAQGDCERGLAQRVATLLHRAGLPTRVPGDLDPAEIVDLMAVDKKRDASGLRLVLPLRVGAVSLRPAPGRDDLIRFLSEHTEGG